MLPTPLHRGTFCYSFFRWIYYYGSNKSTGKETGKSHLCALSTISEGDPYCHVKCEGTSVETSSVKNSQNPEWNESFLFYRRDPKENHMKLSLWNKNLAIDGFIGQALVKSLDPFENTIVLELKGRRSKKEEIVPGTVKVTIENFENLEEI